MFLNMVYLMLHTFCFKMFMFKLKIVPFLLLEILCWLEEQEKKDAEHRIDFLMEVADKTPTDTKGGTLVLYNGALKLLEIAQVCKSYSLLQSYNGFDSQNTQDKLSPCR